jgi:hypothetical protein
MGVETGYGYPVQQGPQPQAGPSHAPNPVQPPVQPFVQQYDPTTAPILYTHPVEGVVIRAPARAPRPGEMVVGYEMYQPR